MSIRAHVRTVAVKDSLPLPHASRNYLIPHISYSVPTMQVAWWVGKQKVRMGQRLERKVNTVNSL